MANTCAYMWVIASDVCELWYSKALSKADYVVSERPYLFYGPIIITL